MKPRLCPNGGAVLVADVAKGIWRCPRASCDWSHLDCYRGEHEEEMSAAEIMAATGAKGLFDVST